MCETLRARKSRSPSRGEEAGRSRLCTNGLAGDTRGLERSRVSRVRLLTSPGVALPTALRAWEKEAGSPQIHRLHKSNIFTPCVRRT